MAEKDLAEELEERLDGDQPMPDEDAPEPDLEDESTDDEDKPDDAEPGPDDADEPEPVRTKKSARDRVQDAIRERDAARAEAQAAQRERDEARRAQQQRDQRQADAEEQQILAGMDEGQKTQYLLAKELKRTQDGQSRIERRMEESADRADFAAKAARDTRRAALMDEVERLYQQHAATSPGLKRDAIYYILLGKKLEDGSLKSAPQRTAAAKRVAAQRAGGRTPRSDTAGRSRGAGDLAARMERDDPAI